MATKGSVFTAAIVGAFALAGVFALSTCAIQKRRSQGTGSAVGTSASEPGQGATSAESPKLDARLTPIIADLVNKFEQHEAISTVLKTELASAAGGVGTTHGTGNYEFKKQDGKRLIRVWLSNKMTISAGDTVYTTAEYVDDLYDGEYLYKQLQQHKLKQVTKRAYSPSSVLQIGGREVFRQLTDGYHLELLGEEIENDGPAYAIEARPIAGKWRAKYLFDKATGIRVRLQEWNEAGELTVDIAVSEINLKPEFSEGNFKPTVPEGFKLIDETVPAGPQP